MKVLFVCSGNSKDGKPKTVVNNQALSLQKYGVEISFFLINKKGIKGYLQSVKPLKKHIINEKFDVIHSHFSLSAFTATLALRNQNKLPHVVSLMGSDAQVSGWKRVLTRYLSNKIWNKTIVKSQKMADDLSLKNYEIIANGVDLDKLIPIEKSTQNLCKTLLFAADPSRESKNYKLAKEALDYLPNKHYELKVVYNKSHSELIQEINNCDCVLLTSKWEGSPNIIKEALALNKPIVATKVGDVPLLISKLEGCYLTEMDAIEISEAIKKAVGFTETQGRKRILELKLDDKAVSNQIISIYNELHAK